jgi:copper(I)-binding protein
MTLTAQRDLTLVGFRTKVAGEAELHDMVMDGDVMRMRALDALSLPAGQPVALRPGPGGKHLMLMGLKGPLKAGDELSLTLKLRTPDGKTLTQTIKVPVQAGPVKPSATSPSAPQPGH